MAMPTRTRSTIYTLVVALMLITWLLLPRIPGLDFTLITSVGLWCMGMGLTYRTPNQAQPDDPMLVTRKLHQLTMTMHGVPTPTPTLPTCPDVLYPAPRQGGGRHRCTLPEGHADLHEHRPLFWNGPPTHRWYRLSNGRTIGW